MCEFCISYNSMKEHTKDSCTGTFLECAIVEETTLFCTGNKKFPLGIGYKKGPRDFNGFQLNFCPECGKKLAKD